jgi:poly-gamma-glutamate synthesis protein (capsule biosynthesis protein)
MKPSFKVVRAYTWKGKLLLAVLRALLRIVSWFKGKNFEQPPLYYHEDPRHFKLKDVIFLAYKYYFRPPFNDGAEGRVRRFFEENPPIFALPTLFKVEKRISLHAAGDLMPYEWIQKRFCINIWDDIAEDFFNADIKFANLESPIDTRRPTSLVPEIMLSNMYFNASTEMFDIFNAPPRFKQRFGAFNVLSTANNHALDMGEQGVLATINFLRQKGIFHVGTAINEQDRLNIPVIEKHGVKIAFVAYTYSMNALTNPNGKAWLVNHLEVNQPDCDLTPLVNDVKYARQSLHADIVVLSLHFGNAYQPYPCEHILKNTQRIFQECGIDILLGTHPHNIQPMARIDFDCPLRKVRRAGFVIFSMADFIAFDVFNWCHLPVYLKMSLVKGTDAHGKRQVLIEKADAIPVFACATYKNKEERSLRLLNAHTALRQLDEQHPPQYLTKNNAKKLKELMSLYKNYFAFNQQ